MYEIENLSLRIFSLICQFSSLAYLLLLRWKLIFAHTHTVLHQTGLEKQTNRVGHSAAGAVRERPRPGLLRLPARSDHGGAVQPSNVQVVRRPEPALVRTARRVRDAVRLRGHPIYGHGLQRVVHVHRDWVPKSVRHQPAQHAGGEFLGIREKPQISSN